MIGSRVLHVSVLAALIAGPPACSSRNMQASPDAGVDASLPGDASPPPDDAGLPPDPTTVAPPLDRGRPTSVFDASSFLYAGDNPIQRGVDPAMIDPRRVAVLRGRVTGQDTSPVTGATITILDHPEFGQTLTRADGAYDLVANGGGDLIVVVRKPGYLEAQRTITAPWQDYVALPEIVLLQPDPAATSVDLTGPGMKVARGSVVTDASGTRRATLLFAPGTQATMAGDSGTHLLPTLTVHLTEFTVGPGGPQAMPGSLPPTSAYTYALEVTVDEAAGRTVELSQPAFLYVENFLGFAPGTGMPVGTYDRTQSKWVGHPNGIVLKILTTADGLATVDSDGDGIADDAATLAALALTDEERRSLATLYTAGQVLWRSPVPHFSTIDCNEPWNLPADARFPGLRPPRGSGSEAVDDGCKSHGSIIQCHNQALGEDLPISGTPYVLHYQSDRQAGRLSDYSADITLSDDKVPASVTAITLDIRVAGRVFHQTFPPTANQHTVFTWDGKDAYGRLTQGGQSATIGVGYVYQASYADPRTFGNQFAQFPGLGITRETSPIPLREQVTITQQWKQTLGPLDAQPLGLGGFTLDVQHTYDATGKILYLGSGDTRRATTIGQTILDGRHSIVAQVPSEPSTFGISRLALRSDGGYYVADERTRVVYDETGRIVAGILELQTVTPPPCAYSGEGGPATQAPMCFVTEVVTAPDGSLYVIDSRHVRRIGRDGIIHTIAGTLSTFSNPCTPTGVDGPALEARLCEPHDLVVANDGAVYFADNSPPQIYKIGVDGYLSIIAGNGTVGFAGDGGPAQQAMLSNQVGLATAPDGSILVVDKGNLRVRRITTNGLISTIAGTGDSGDTGDGGPATSATFKSLSDAAVAPDGAVYIADNTSRRFRVVTPQGLIAAFAGGGLYSTPVSGCCVPPTDAQLVGASYVRLGADGAVYLNDGITLAYYRVVSALPSFAVGEQVIPSESGSEAYVFDSAGRHLRTLDASTGTVLLKFGYDAAGRLATLTDLDGKVTRIERNAAGAPTAIVAPFGQRTSLTLESAGYLGKLTDPAGGSHVFTYGNGGLLATYTDPLGGLHEFTYGAAGRLTADNDPGHSKQTLTRTGDATDSTVTVTTELGRTMSYRIERLPTGDEVWTNTLADGGQVRVQRKADGSATTSLPDGTTMSLQVGPDPRFGMQAPVPASLTIHTPGGLVHTQTTTRSVRLAGSDPLVVSSATETFTLNGKTFTRFYDGNAKTVTITSPLRRQTKATFDNNGRIVTVTNPSVNAMQILYDSLGRPTSAAQGVRQLSLAYGGDGRITSSSDALGRTVTYDRDPLGRIKQQHGPDDSVIEFGFDAASNLLRVRPPGETDHRVDRDILGLVHSYFAPEVGPDTSQTTYDYSADHQITSITPPDGTSLALAYDTSGRPHRLTFPDGMINATYDSAGRLATLDAPDGAGVSFGYDASLPTDITWTGPVHGTLHITFDNDFRVSSESVNGEPAIPARYDDDGLLSGIGALAITRDTSTGRMKQASIGSVTETYTFNDLGELSNTAASCGSTSLHSIALTRDAAGVITGEDETLLGDARSLAYDHDSFSRLVAVHGVTPSMYTYDRNGNRLTALRPDLTTYTYDAQDRLIQQGNSAYTYTASGQLQTKSEPAGATSYHYDLLGNLRAVQLPSGRTITYVIDGMNHRIGRAVDGVLVQGLLYDIAAGPIAELDGAGAVVSRFIYGTRSNVPDYLVKGGILYRILTDAVGSPRVVVDVGSCQVVQRVDYDEFGRVLVDTNPGFQPFGFAGGLRDPDTGLLRFGARDYDPEIGRWTAKDPLGFAGSDSNLYAYAANNPINLIDPSGLSFAQSLTDFSAGFGDMATFGLTRWVRRPASCPSTCSRVEARRSRSTHDPRWR